MPSAISSACGPLRRKSLIPLWPGVGSRLALHLRSCVVPRRGVLRGRRGVLHYPVPTRIIAQAPGCCARPHGAQPRFPPAPDPVIDERNGGRVLDLVHRRGTGGCRARRRRGLRDWPCVCARRRCRGLPRYLSAAARRWGRPGDQLPAVGWAQRERWRACRPCGDPCLHHRPQPLALVPAQLSTVPAVMALPTAGRTDPPKRLITVRSSAEAIASERSTFHLRRSVGCPPLHSVLVAVFDAVRVEAEDRRAQFRMQRSLQNIDDGAQKWPEAVTTVAGAWVTQPPPGWFVRDQAVRPADRSGAAFVRREHDHGYSSRLLDAVQLPVLAAHIQAPIGNRG